VETHIRIVGILHLVIGLLSLLAGLVGVIGIFALGALGGAVAWSDSGAGAGLLTGGFFGVVLLVILVSLLVTSLPSIFAGWGLLGRKAWAPAVAVVISLFHLANFPFGSALAVYTWWGLLSKEGQKAYGLGKMKI
jgi:hypothetical protein